MHTSSYTHITFFVSDTHIVSKVHSGSWWDQLSHRGNMTTPGCPVEWSTPILQEWKHTVKRKHNERQSLLHYQPVSLDRLNHFLKIMCMLLIYKSECLAHKDLHSLQDSIKPWKTFSTSYVLQLLALVCSHFRLQVTTVIIWKRLSLISQPISSSMNIYYVCYWKFYSRMTRCAYTPTHLIHTAFALFMHM